MKEDSVPGKGAVNVDRIRTGHNIEYIPPSVQ